MAAPWRRLTSTGWITIVTILFILLLGAGMLRPVQRLVTPVLKPIGRVSYAIVDSVQSFFRHRSSATELQRENTDLRARLVQAELDRAALNQQLAELNISRAEADFLQRRSLQGVTARVIGRSQTNAQALLVDVGTRQGITVGAPVLASGGVLIGTIIEANDVTSNVRLLTAEGTNVAVRVEKQDGPSGILVGERGVGTRLTLVPRTDSLQPKQTVITSDVNPQVPSGLLIGAISVIDAAPGALFQTATVVPTVPYESLNVLTILRRP
jgi:rod shape-determining protein MreC